MSRRRRVRGPKASVASDLQIDHQVLGVGPSHPATRGTVKLVTELDGETIVDLDVEVGYLHRGFEKECEAGTWQQAIPYTDRLNYCSAIICNHAYCMAVEKLCGCELPRRGLWVRTLASELSRIGDHLTRLGAGCLELGAMTPFLYAIEARELNWDLQELLCGARVTSSYLRIGGVSRDVPEGFEERCEEVLRESERLLRDLDRMVTANRIFVDRLRNTGRLARDRCIDQAITGPLLRAAGVPYDVRKAEPYLVYEELEFDVPIGSVGDNFDRFLVVQEEIHQSIRILRQCLPVLRQTRGERVDVADPRVPRGRPSHEATEALRVPLGEAYAKVESPNGELGFYVVSDGGERPYKVRCRPPSFLNVAPLAEMLRGGMLADLGPTFDMLNVIGGECDR